MSSLHRFICSVVSPVIFVPSCAGYENRYAFEFLADDNNSSDMLFTSSGQKPDLTLTLLGIVALALVFAIFIGCQYIYDPTLDKEDS